MAGSLPAPYLESDPPTSPPRSRISGRQLLALLPILALLAAIAVLAIWRGYAVWNPPGLLAALNILFLTVVSLGVAQLAARGFLTEHSSPSLLLGSGALALGTGAFLAATGIPGPDANSLVTVYNTSACLAGLCHLASALSAQGSGPRVWRQARVVLACSYVGVLLLLAAIVLLVRAGAWPVFFVEGSGQTAVGKAVIWVTAALFALSALLLGLRARGTQLGFLHWYSWGLWLIAVGLVGVSLQDSLGDPLNWAGRSGQYLGGVYMLVAAFSSVRSSGLWMLPVERALRQSEQRWAATLASIGDGVIATDLAGRVTFMNAMAERLTGWAMAEALDRPIAEVFRLEREHLHQRPGGSAAIPSDGGRAARLSGASVLVRRDGAEVPVEDVSAPIRDEVGRTNGAVHIFRDITERRRAEEWIGRQNAILDGVNRMLLGALEEGTEEAFGQSCLAIVERITESSFGFIAEIGPTGKLDNIAISDPGWDACRMEDPSGHRRSPVGFAIHGIYGRVVLDGKGFFTNDAASHPDRVGTPDGHPPIRSFLGVPLKHGDETVGMLAVANRPGGYRVEDQEALEALAPVFVQALLHRRARAERNRLLAAEQAARAEAEAAVRMREEFISIAAHELRTPVTSLLGYSQMLLRRHARTGDFDETWLAKGISNIDRQSRRLSRLADQLLNFSRLEAGRLAITTEATDLAQLVTNAVDEVRQANPGRELALRTRGEMAAHVDPLRLTQVVVNLLDNALKFSPAHAAVEISLEPDGEHAILSVRDYGMGIAPEKRALIFERFYQAHDERHYGGMGIGLYISREIVHLHQGTISVESPEGGGSRFVVRLPMIRRPQPDGGSAAAGSAE